MDSQNGFNTQVHIEHPWILKGRGGVVDASEGGEISMVHIVETFELDHLDFSRNIAYPNMAMLFEKSNLDFGEC